MAALVLFEADGTRGETLVCDGRIGGTLAAEGIAWGRWPLHGVEDAAEDAAVSHADAERRFFMEGAGLFYIRTAQGFIGLLCEAGEWVELPPGVHYNFDAGGSPVDGALPVALPSFDEFVETLLELTGHAAAEEEG